MKKLIPMCISLFILGVSISANAQTTTCYIDLSSAAASLVQAQAQASSGDTASAVAKLRELQAQLDAIIANCDGATTSSNTPPITTPPPPTTLPDIDTIYVSQNELLSFVLPAGWVAFEQGNSIFIGTSQNTAQSLAQFTPPVGEELGAGFVLGSTQEIAPTLRQGTNFVDVLVAYQSQLRNAGFTVTEELTPVTWRDKPSGRFNFQSENMAGIMQVIEIQADGAHLLIFVTSAIDYTGDLDTLLTDLLDSVEIALPS